MLKEAMIPFELALESFYEGKKGIKMSFIRDDGYITKDSIKGYFRTYPDFPEHEKLALKNCKGRVLDIGAGVGPHALELQKRGLNVLALDISEKACELMKKRGIKKVYCGTPYDLDKENFDTILILGCSIGFVEDLEGLKHFLEYAKSLLKQDGIMLLDSRDIRMTENATHIEYQQNNIKSGKYRGEIRIKIKFEDVTGEIFQILHIDPDTLMKISKDSGWNAEIIHREDGMYLARLNTI